MSLFRRRWVPGTDVFPVPSPEAAPADYVPTAPQALIGPPDSSDDAVLASLVRRFFTDPEPSIWSVVKETPTGVWLTIDGSLRLTAAEQDVIGRLLG